MSQMCYMSGYGVSLNKLSTLLKAEYDDMSSSEIIERIEDSMFCTFGGEEDYIYIPNRAPYEEAPFANINEIDKYFYEKLKLFLLNSVTLDQIAELLDDVFDWEYC